MSFVRDVVVPAILSRGLEFVFEPVDGPAFAWRKSGTRWKGSCPYHDSKSGTSLWLDTTSLFWQCDGCADERVNGKNIHGDPIRWLAWLDGNYHGGHMPWDVYAQYLDQLCGIVGIERRELSAEQREVLRQQHAYSEFLEHWYAVCTETLLADTDEARAALAYLQEKGISREAAVDFEIGLFPPQKVLVENLRQRGCNLDESFVLPALNVFRRQMQQYVSFAWRDEYGQPLTLYGDLIDKTLDLPPKMALPNVGDMPSKRSPLYFDLVLKSDPQEVLLVEGVRDGAVCHISGLANTIACVGRGLSAEQAKTLGRHGVQNCVIQLDPDAGGNSGTAISIRLCVEQGIVPYVAPRLPDGMDPDDFILANGANAFKTHIGGAVPGVIWQIQQTLVDREYSELTASEQALVLTAIGEHIRAWTLKSATVEKALLECLVDVFGMGKVDARAFMKNAGGRVGATASCYEMNPTGIYRKTEEGAEQLTNFSSEIIADVEVHGGLVDSREAELRGVIAGQSYQISVPTREFGAMTWPLERLGTRAIVAATHGAREHIRKAIQQLSTNITSKRVYLSTGWEMVDGQMVYLHGNGAIGPDGNDPNVTVRLTDRLANYRFEGNPAGEELQKAVRLSLELLDVAPARVMLPCLAAVYRSVLGPSPFAVELIGRTGSFKTELLALCQQHFGAAMDARCLPANWSSTENALQAQAYYVRDALFSIDDFVVEGNPERFYATAARVLRGAGNVSGRGRLTADSTLRRTPYCRGLILMSGEDKPAGESISARLFVIEVGRGDVQLMELTEAQRRARDGVYAGAMAGYLQWVSRNYQSRVANLPERLNERRQLGGEVYHRRTGDIVAQLLIGWQTFLEFAVAVEAIERERQAELLDLSREVLLQAASDQETINSADDPVKLTLELLRDLFDSGRAHLVDLEDDEEAPPDAEMWGWLPNEHGILEKRGERIGRLGDDGLVRLITTTTAALLQQQAAGAGHPGRLTVRLLGRRLDEAGVIEQTRKGYHSAVVYERKQRVRRWLIRAEKIRPECIPQMEQ